MNPSKILIMRDPTSADLKFLKGQPGALLDKMSRKEWEGVIEEINEAVRDKISFLGILKNISFLFLFDLSGDGKKEIDFVIERINLKFKSRGVYFCNPKGVHFQELEIQLLSSLRMDSRQEYNDSIKISYTKRLVEIDTVDGLPIQVELWCSDINPKTIKFQDKKIPSVFKCDICGKEFDENKKMLLHKNYHSIRK